MKNLILIVVLCIAKTTFSQSITLTPDNFGKISPFFGENKGIFLDTYKTLNFGQFGVSHNNIRGRAASGSLSNPGATSWGLVLLSLQGIGHDGTNFRSSPSAAINFITNQQWSSTAHGTRIEFITTPNDDFSPRAGMVINGSGNVSVGGFGDEATLQVKGDLAISLRVLLQPTTQTINNLNRQNRSRITSVASTTPYITTISGIADGVDGLILYIHPVQNATIILQHENTDSTDINRIITHTNANVSIANNGGATLMYDATADRWRVISVAN